MKNPRITKEEYLMRINRVIDFISNNLNREIEINELSQLSYFSPYHFHRVFRGIVGENVGKFIIRKRAETAATLLRHTQLPISQIAYEVGYDTPSSLTKIFRQFYQISPTEYRNNKNYGVMKSATINLDLNIKKPKIVEIEPKQLIYIRHSGNYSEIDYEKTWQSLWQHVKENKLFTAGIEHLCIYHNDPKLTEEEKFITDVCLAIHKPAQAKGEIGVKEFSGGKFAMFLYTGSYEHFESVYDTIYGKLIPEYGYELRTEPGFDKYIGHPGRTAPEKLKTEIYIPVK